MAHSDRIDAAALEMIARQVGDRISSFRLQSGYVTLHESLQLWLLPAESLIAAPVPNLDLLQVAVRSGRWHHQLRDGNTVFGFARSSHEPGNRWVLHEVFDTPIAGEIDTGITIVDEQVYLGDPLVRLVFAPAYHLYALWLIDERNASSRSVVVHAPIQFAVPRNEIIESRYLLGLLSTQPAIVGVSS